MNNKAFIDSNVFIYFDCLMIASALDSDCRFLIIEDLSDGQVIDKKLTIINMYSEQNIKIYLDS